MDLRKSGFACNCFPLKGASLLEANLKGEYLRLSSKFSPHYLQKKLMEGGVLISQGLSPVGTAEVSYSCI